jgi:hypothetical protein
VNRQHGEDAEVTAAQRADLMEEREDHAGRRVGADQAGHHRPSSRTGTATALAVRLRKYRRSADARLYGDLLTFREETGGRGDEDALPMSRGFGYATWRMG